MPRTDAALAEAVCLALVVEESTHGWALARSLAPGAEVGRIWSVSRPLTYRAVDQLVADGWLTRTGRQPGGGRDRTILAATAKGRRRSRRWLDQPVAHLRDVRSELLVKLELRRRAGLALRPLLEAQQVAFAPVIQSLEDADPAGWSGRAPSTAVPDREADAIDAADVVDVVDVVDLWRRESAAAAARFLAAALAQEAGPQADDTKVTSRHR